MNIKRIDQFKTQMKGYYKNKNLKMRYIVVGFLLLILILQFLGRNRYEVDSTKEVHISHSDSEFSFAGQIIPLDDQYFFNQERLDRELAITKLNIDQFVMIHKREPQYLPYITSELKKAGVPEDFAYLAVAESALRNNAYSVAGAAGIWQFMPATARAQGLVVDTSIDERLHFEKATQAAIFYLKQLYAQFGDWTLVAAAYNRGENGLERDLAWQGIDNYYDAWLNSETARYVFRIIANKHLLEHRYEYFDETILGSQYQQISTKTIEVGAIEDLAQRALKKGYTYKLIRELNPWILGNTLPEGNWEIKVLKK